MIVQRYCLSPRKVKCSHIKYDVFQLATYHTSIHLVVKRYQAKWRFIYFYMCQLFLVLLPFPASHRNMKLLPKVLSQVNDKKASRLFLKIRIAFFAVSCFRSRMFLPWSAALRRSGLSECKFQRWPKGANIDETAELRRCKLGRQGAPALRWEGCCCPEGSRAEGRLRAKRDRALRHKSARRIFKELPLWEVMVPLKPNRTANIQLDFTWIFFWKKTKEKMSK